MNAELTELVFILDRSGSMNGLESDVIGGFNGMISRQKEEGEKVNVTTVLFLFLGANIDAVKEAEKMGIIRERAVTYENDCKGVAINYETIGRTVMKAVKSRNCRVEIDENWADEIVEYRKSKKGEA